MYITKYLTIDTYSILFYNPFTV